MKMEKNQNIIQASNSRRIYQTTGNRWMGVPEIDAIEKSIRNSLFSVCVENENNLVGFGRIVRDNSIYFYIQDVIVLPRHRGKGYSILLMKELINFLRHKANIGSFIGLFSDKGTEGLYEKFGFKKRSGYETGAGVYLPVDKLL